MDKLPTEVVDFMENIETLEDDNFEKAKDKSKDKKKSAATSPAKKKKFYCSHHGPNNTHDTADCNALKKKSGDFNKKKKPYPNKTWVKKAAEANSVSKKELAALVQKEAKKVVKKQLAAVSKKRKGDDSDKDEADCFLLEELSKGIDGFNYEDMEKLSINDKEEGEISDEVSV